MTDEATKRNIDLAFAVVEDALSGLERARQIEDLAAGRTLVFLPTDDPEHAKANKSLASRARGQGMAIVEVEVQRHIDYQARRGSRTR